MGVVLTTHVDDFLWACTKKGHAVVDRLLTRFEVGRKEERGLRFCGKQFDASGHDDRVDWLAEATQIADCLTKSMKPTHMLRVLDTCKYQISHEGYAKPSANSEVAAPVGQPKLESARTEQ